MSTEPTLYIILRTDLGMSVGKISTQSGHATDLALAEAERIRPAQLAAYRSNGVRRKITLKAKNLEVLMRAFNECHAANLPCGLQVDLGRTELSPDTMTAAGIGPVLPDELPKFVRRMRLLD